MALESERLAIAAAVRNQLAIENALSPEQARLFVRSLQISWEVKPNVWSEAESRRQMRDARRLLHAADIFTEIEGTLSEGAKECYRRAAEIFEWLVRSDDQLKVMLPVSLLSGAAYQLGDLPAMAASLLKQKLVPDQLSSIELDYVFIDDPDEVEHPMATYPEIGHPSIGVKGAELYAAFFQGDFDQTLQRCAQFWADNIDLTGRSGSTTLLTEDANDRVAWYLVAELVRSVGLVADCLRQNIKDRLAKAIEKLRGLEKLAIRSSSEDVWMLISLIRATAEKYTSASIYSHVASLASTPDGLKWANRYCRKQFKRGRGILWTSQIHGLKRLAQSKSFALCTPTGSGKTLVANLALVKELMIAKHDGLLGPLALYVVPSRALASEVEGKLSDELGEELIITGLYGGTDWGITDYWLTAEKPTVLIATVEKAEALIRYLGPLLMNRLHLLIVDEAHQVVSESDENAEEELSFHENRAIRLESFVSRLIALKPSLVRIALTAVAGGGANPVARWMEGSTESFAVGVNYRSTRQLIGVLECSPNSPSKILLDLMNGKPLYVKSREDAVYLNLKFAAMPSEPREIRTSVDKYNQLNILWTALQLRQSGRRILISVAQEPEQTMRWFTAVLRYEAWQGLIKFEEPADGRLKDKYNEAVEACIDYCGESSFEVQLLKHGIATSHGQMPQRLRRLMVYLIDKKVCTIAVATATLTEGVNLPFDLIFLTALKRSSYDQKKKKSKLSPITTSEFRNLSGRAGRPGAAESVEGITLIGLLLKPPTTAPKTIPVQQKQIDTMAEEYQTLLDNLAIEATGSTVASPLSVLLKSIWKRYQAIGLPAGQFYNWLENVYPETVYAGVGDQSTTPQGILSNSLDELDGHLIAALEEADKLQLENLTQSEAEEFLLRLWRSSFSNFAAVQESWLEHAFIKRGGAIVSKLYPDPSVRSQLYQFGYSPCVGRRFLDVVPAIETFLVGTSDYGSMSTNDRFDVFVKLGEMVKSGVGFGFKVRDTKGDQDILRTWTTVLGWWMQLPNSQSPTPEGLRSWQRFVADNLEFRLGNSIGAVVANVWSQKALDASTPDLATWREVTGLPWFPFWAKELLRWGTLDPFVAFCMAQGLARTREVAGKRRHAFELFLSELLDGVVKPDDLIDPRYFLNWQRSLEKLSPTHDSSATTEVTVVGADGTHARYPVIPATREGEDFWFDPAGYLLARSLEKHATRSRQHSDHVLELGGVPVVRHVET